MVEPGGRSTISEVKLHLSVRQWPETNSPKQCWRGFGPSLTFLEWFNQSPAKPHTTCGETCRWQFTDNSHPVQWSPRSTIAHTITGAHFTFSETLQWIQKKLWAWEFQDWTRCCWDAWAGILKLSLPRRWRVSLTVNPPSCTTTPAKYTHTSIPPSKWRLFEHNSHVEKVSFLFLIQKCSFKRHI